MFLSCFDKRMGKVSVLKHNHSYFTKYIFDQFPQLFSIRDLCQIDSYAKWHLLSKNKFQVAIGGQVAKKAILEYFGNP